ncbi:MAG: dihydrofolate reductase [Anaerolineales bacterium]|nr:dihydrofolate reductase [Anaerolineales bacterium]
MPTKVSVYIAVSVDGFIARKNGDIDWLPTGSEDGEDFGYADFMSSIDHIVMGRNTFEKVLTFGGWPYDRKVIMLTSRDLTLSPNLTEKVETLRLSPRELLQEMERRGAKGIYLDGGVTIQRFLREGLVDEMTITTIPILIGEGLPLFGALEKDIKLELIEARSFPNGFVQKKYRTATSQ